MKKKIEIESFLQFQFVSSPAVSKDGKYVAFQVARADRADNNYKTDLWCYNTQTQALETVVDSGKVRSFTWLSNGHILFQAACGDCDTHYFEVDPAEKEPKEVFSLPMEVWSVTELENGKLLIQGINDNMNLNAGPRDYEVIEETPFWFNGYGFIQGKRKGLYLYDRAEGSCTLVTDPWSDVAYFSVRGNRVVYQVYPWKNAMIDPFRPALCLYDAQTGETKQLLEKHQYVSYQIAFWKDNELLFSSTEEAPDGEGQCVDFYAMDLTTGKYSKCCDVGYCIGVNSVTSDARYGGGQVAKYTDDGYYFLSTIGEQTWLNKLDKDCNLTLQMNDTHGKYMSIDSFDLCCGHIASVEMTKSGMAELYYDGKQVTHFNDAYLEAHAISDPEFHAFTGSEGFEIHGWCMKPVGYEAGNQYPAVLHIHGGPACAFGEVYHHEMQLWANKGYFVIFCNPIGSDGRGAAFMDINGKWGTIDYQSIMEFTDEMLAKYPDIDESKVAVCGGSYGGYMTNWVIGHTNRFAAAVSQRSLSNIIGYEFSSDIGLMCTYPEHRATTETDAAELWKQSPLKYAPNCTTPTLFIHSDEDYRCYMTDAIAMFTALKAHGCDAKMCLFHGENHDLSRTGKPENRISRMKEILSWLDAYLK